MVTGRSAASITSRVILPTSTSWSPDRGVDVRERYIVGVAELVGGHDEKHRRLDVGGRVREPRHALGLVERTVLASVDRNEHSVRHVRSYCVPSYDSGQ